MNKRSRILIVDFSNFEDYPIGGYLSFSRNMINSFGSRLALVGISTSSEEPIGKWFIKSIDGKEFDYFALARYQKSKTKHIIPDRLAIYFLIKLYGSRIREIGIKNVFIQRQEIFLSLQIKSRNVCYSFAGLENPLAISKYWYGRFLARPFESIFFDKLRSVSVILARGDDASISDLIRRSSGAIATESIVKFPTRIDTEIFRPMDKEESRKTLGLALSTLIVVTTGRLAEYKGWKFMVDSFIEFQKSKQESIFLFIGEGEDFHVLKTYISECNMEQHVLLTGKQTQPQIALYLNAADLFIMGSYKEGWSTSLMEASACGIPACVTDFSSARDIIMDGENGYVVNNHDKTIFVECMSKALMIPRPVKNDHILLYSTQNLQSDILKNWHLA
ncbi:MAG TPA: glycosyltransferase [Bacteroidales bacterium]|jgi:glycosyltransferase involved in cell wall biosynthesis|nr:glycosyltransferase [Bacteroidales bacterium]